LANDPIMTKSGKTPRKLRVEVARNRERVLKAAAEVFAERGLEATLNDVAHRAGLGVGTVYRRFPNKEALVESLFEDQVEGLIALATEANGHPDAWEGFVSFFDRALQMQVGDRGLREVLLHGEYGRDRIAEVKVRIGPILTELIERAEAEGHLRSDFVVEDVPMLMTMIGSVADYTRKADPELWRRYLAMFLDGLVTSRSSMSPLGTAPTQEVVAQAIGERP
jgi:AcrR family transcriptional regulator